MYTVRQSITDLLSQVAPAQRLLPPQHREDDPIPACLSAVHGALAELSTLGPLWQFRARRGAVIHAPATVVIPTLDQHATAFTLAEPAWQSWMLGCSIQISGETTWNEITGYDAATGQVRLLHPVLHGFGTNVSARVFGDCLQLPADVQQVLPPVALADHYELRAARNLSQIQQAQYDYWRTEDYGRSATYQAARRRTADSPGPRLYWHDTAYDGGSSPAVSRLRLGPMPIAEAILHYRARISPPRFTEADVYLPTDPSIDPGVPIPVREDLVDTVFQPIVRQRFTASPLFRNDNVLPELKRQYETALHIARSLSPQGASGAIIQPGY